MSDESCLKCDNPLYVDQKCSDCCRIFQEICMYCGQKTIPRYHTCELVNENWILV
jgi:hypothetical protein